MAAATGHGDSKSGGRIRGGNGLARRARKSAESYCHRLRRRCRNCRIDGNCVCIAGLSCTPNSVAALPALTSPRFRDIYHLKLYINKNCFSISDSSRFNFIFLIISLWIVKTQTLNTKIQLKFQNFYFCYEKIVFTTYCLRQNFRTFTQMMMVPKWHSRRASSRHGKLGTAFVRHKEASRIVTRIRFALSHARLTFNVDIEKNALPLPRVFDMPRHTCWKVCSQRSRRIVTRLIPLTFTILLLLRQSKLFHRTKVKVFFYSFFHIYPRCYKKMT